MFSPKPLLAILLTTATLLTARATWAGGSEPVLSITAVTPLASADRARAVTVQGTFNFDDLMQFSFPAGVIVSQGSRFARYDLDGQIVQGTAASVADGVTDNDVRPLLRIGTPAPAPARVMQLRVDRISLSLPPGFTAGSASVVLYAVLESDPFVSNSVAVTLP